MERLVITDFAVKYDLEELRQRLRVKPGSKAEAQLVNLVAAAGPISRPKAAILAERPELGENDEVRLGGTLFRSGLLHKHLDGQNLAVAYVATCGRELAAWAGSLKGLEQFLADEIMINCLRQGMAQLEARLRERFGLEMVSAMNPGSLPREWPIIEQRPLFDLLGDLPGQIGVELLPSFLMKPGKSVSGIFFKTEEKFHNCQLCTKENCPGRKAPYLGGMDAAAMMA